ncbi:hypothetical protein ACLK1T_01195 [Escherichia coli]
MVPPQFEARNDFDIFRELCRRFNREEAFTKGWTKWAGLNASGRKVYNKAKDAAFICQRLMTSGITKGRQVDHPQMFVRHQAFREGMRSRTAGHAESPD